MKYKLTIVLFLSVLIGCDSKKDSILNVEPTDSLVAVSTARVLMNNTNPEPAPKKPKTKDCTVCKGKGKVLSGDGLAWIPCDACEPEPKQNVVQLEPEILVSYSDVKQIPHIEIKKHFTKYDIDTTNYSFPYWKFSYQQSLYTDIRVSLLSEDIQNQIKDIILATCPHDRYMIGGKEKYVQDIYNTAIIHRLSNGQQYIVAIINDSQVMEYWNIRRKLQ